MRVSTATTIEKLGANAFKQRRPLLGRSGHVRARIFLSAFGIFAGVVHLALAGPHFEEATWLGTAFLADGLGLGMAGVWMLLSETRRATRAAGVAAALTVLAYLGSRTIGLPGMEREAWDALGVVTTVAELAILVSWLLLERSEREAAVEAAA